MTTVDNPYEKVRRKLVASRIEFMGQLAKFSKDELAARPGDDEWSALEIANHLYITDGLALQEMRRVQSEDNPLIAALDEEGPRQTRASGPPASLDAVLAGMVARREEIFEYLASLPVEAWMRPFRHHTWGQLKFYQLVNVIPQHDQIHARQLAKIRREES